MKNKSKLKADTQNSGSNATRKRKKRSREELHNEEAEIKYSKLVHISQGKIRKEAKICKTFECQKIVRKIKALNKSSHDDNENHDDDRNVKTSEVEQNEDIKDSNSKKQRRIRNLEEKLKLTRAFQLDDLVEVCLKRLGLDFSKSKKRKSDSTDSAAENNCEENECTKEAQEYYTTLIESMLQHKKMISAVEVVNKSVLEYNTWQARREQWLSNGSKSSSKKISHAYGQMNQDISEHRQNTGLFINSLAGEEVDYSNEGEGEDGENYDEYVDEPKKKNRMGQRARKAVAIARETKYNGRGNDDSRKMWWELEPKNPKKMKQDHNELASGLDVSKKVEVAQVAEMGKSWKEEGKAHPSWAARQLQKSKSGSGIGSIEFTGKKITFD
mmetsp:Transcript_3776/g.4451  ORF Transcript_3776/g.4451 Transcript_3776/m.4451 type:complete len:385 (+) Transcript_3776:83-1237(+)